MLQGNAGLKPKEGEYTSRPWEWPINLRVSFKQSISMICQMNIQIIKLITSHIMPWQINCLT